MKWALYKYEYILGRRWANTTYCIMKLYSNLQSLGHRQGNEYKNINSVCFHVMHCCLFSSVLPGNNLCCIGNPLYLFISMILLLSSRPSCLWPFIIILFDLYYLATLLCINYHINLVNVNCRVISGSLELYYIYLSPFFMFVFLICVYYVAGEVVLVFLKLKWSKILVYLPQRSDAVLDHWQNKNWLE